MPEHTRAYQQIASLVLEWWDNPPWQLDVRLVEIGVDALSAIQVKIRAQLTEKIGVRNRNGIPRYTRFGLGYKRPLLTVYPYGVRDAARKDRSSDGRTATSSSDGPWP